MRTAQLAYKSNMRNDDSIACAAQSARRPDLQSKHDLSVSSAMVSLVKILSIRASPPYPSHRSKSGFQRNGTGPTLADCSVSFLRRGGSPGSPASFGVLGSSAHGAKSSPVFLLNRSRLCQFRLPSCVVETRAGAVSLGEGWGGRS
jgi:hypothetical protein